VQGARGDPQDLVADRVAQRVVDLLEVVEVEDQHRPAGAVAAGEVHLLAHGLEEAPAVEDPRQDVVVGEEAQLGFEVLAIADVARDRRGADDAARRVDQRRDVQRDVHERPVPAPANRLVRLDLLALADAREDARNLVRPVLGRQHGAGAADGLLGRVPVEALGARVPAHDRAIELRADDRVGAGVHDRRQAQPVLLGGPHLGDVQQDPAPVGNPVAVALERRVVVHPDGVPVAVQEPVVLALTSPGSLAREHLLAVGRMQALGPQAGVSTPLLGRVAEHALDLRRDETEPAAGAGLGHVENGRHAVHEAAVAALGLRGSIGGAIALIGFVGAPGCCVLVRTGEQGRPPCLLSAGRGRRLRCVRLS
jgi:hypothetical protein